MSSCILGALSVLQQTQANKNYAIARVISAQHLATSLEPNIVAGGDCFRVVARFRQRDDAAAYLQVLQKSNTNSDYAIAFSLLN